VVSKMTTRSCSDFADVVMIGVLLVVCALIRGFSWGSVFPVPLSAQARNAQPALRGR
jgi:hypothetical protein